MDKDPIQPNDYFLFLVDSTTKKQKDELIQRYSMHDLFGNNIRLFQTHEQAHAYAIQYGLTNITMVCRELGYELLSPDFRQSYFQAGIRIVIFLTKNWQTKLKIKANKYFQQQLHQHQVKIGFSQDEKKVFKEMIVQMICKNLKEMKQRKKKEWRAKIYNLNKMNTEKIDQAEWKEDQKEVEEQYCMADTCSIKYSSKIKKEIIWDMEELLYSQASLSIFSAYYEAFQIQHALNDSQLNHPFHNSLVKESLQNSEYTPGRILSQIIKLAEEVEPGQKAVIVNWKQFKHQDLDIRKKKIDFMLAFCFLYTGEAVYRQLNRKMRKNCLPFKRELHQLVYQGILQFRQENLRIRLFSDCTIYRGSSHIEQNLVQEQQTEWSTFSSCSLDKRIAKGFLADDDYGTFYNIKLSKEDKCSYIAIEWISQYFACPVFQAEILLLPGFSFVVKKVTKNGMLRGIKLWETSESREAETGEFEVEFDSDNLTENVSYSTIESEEIIGVQAQFKRKKIQLSL